MVKFIFKYNTETIATVHDVNRFANKEISNQFAEALTQQLKALLLYELSDIRQHLEDEAVTVECNFIPETQDLTMAWASESDELMQLIQNRLI